MKLYLVGLAILLTAANIDSQSLDQQMSDALRGAKDPSERTTKSLIAQGIDPNGTTKDGTPYLYVAVRRQMKETVELLVARGADVNVKAPTQSGNTPLFEATSSADGNLAKFLIGHKAQVNVTNDNGATPLHFAASVGHEKVIDLLFKAGAKLNAQDAEGTTPLMEAASNGKMAAIGELIALGADVKGEDKHRLTALAHAALSQQPEAIVALAHAGASIDTPSMQGNLPLLFSCILNKRSGSVAGLVSAGADLKPLYQGYTPLGYAVGISRDVPTVKAILSGKPDLDAFSHEGFAEISPEPKSLPYHERTALMQAAESGNIELIKLLLTAGANKDIKSNDQKTALDLALENGHQESADLFK